MANGSPPWCIGSYVDDLAAYGRKIVEAGGRLLVERQEVPGMGAFALFEDPEKRVLGIWQQTK